MVPQSQDFDQIYILFHSSPSSFSKWQNATLAKENVKNRSATFLTNW